MATRTAKNQPAKKAATKPRKAAQKSLPAAADTPAVPYRMVPLDRIRPAGDNPRGGLGDVTQLAASVARHGILEPLVVTNGAGGTVTLVAGHRRHAAAQAAGLDEAPCVVRGDLDDAGRLELMLVENLDRADLTPLEEAAAYRRLHVDLGWSQQRIAERLSRSQGHVSKRLALLDLPDKARDAVAAGDLTLDDARELGKLGPDAQARVLAIGNAESRRYRIGHEREMAERAAALHAKVDELAAEGLPAQLHSDDRPPGWRLIAATGHDGRPRSTVGVDYEQRIKAARAAGVLGVVVWPDLIQWYSTDPDWEPPRDDGPAPARDTPTPARDTDATDRTAHAATGRPRGDVRMRAAERLDALVDRRRGHIREQLARVEGEHLAFVAAQQLDMAASTQGAWTSTRVEVIPLSAEGVDLAGEWAGTDDYPAGLLPGLLDGRRTPAWTLLALALADVEEYLADHARQTRYELRRWDDDDDPGGRVVTRHYRFLAGLLGYEPDPLEAALVAGDDLDDPKVQTRLGLTGGEA